jgi:hypothetical protein
MEGVDELTSPRTSVLSYASNGLATQRIFELLAMLHTSTRTD